MGRPAILVFLLACTICAALAPPAIGQEVRTDPDSPSGTEYQIPIERARDTGARDGGNPKQAGERSAPLFGEGIDRTSEDETDDADTAVAPAGRDDDGGGGNGRDDGGAASAKTRGGSLATADPVPTAATTDDDSDGLPLVLGLGGLILAMGAGLGYVLRRRGGRPVDDSA